MIGFCSKLCNWTPERRQNILFRDKKSAKNSELTIHKTSEKNADTTCINSNRFNKTNLTISFIIKGVSWGYRIYRTYEIFSRFF